MRIIFTGTPGTGKTTVSKIVSKKLGLKHVEGSEIIRKKGLREGYDVDLSAVIVDEKNLAREFEKFDDCVIDSHLSYFMSSKKVLLCVVLRCDTNKLISRLEERKYSPEKVRENVQSEVMNVCGNDAFERGHVVLEINTSKRSVSDVARIVLEKVDFLLNG
ncbi:MAG: AAA family ATPase [Nanoarchaeota archaeon]|nr:AAA family ATPase [Nanoarchaeota archaeon]